MNERIRQLALEAFQPINDITTEGVADHHTFDQAWFQHYNQKFAELIIRECVGVVEGGSFLHDQAPTAIFARECSGAIKRHFGVKND